MARAWRKSGSPGWTVYSAARGVCVPPERRRVGMVFQSYALWPHLTAGANVGYPLRAARMGAAERRARAAEMLEAVGLADRAGRYPGELSGGQQQRIALARAMAAHPRLMLFDEPLSNLDAKLRVGMRTAIRRLQREIGTTAVYVTHDQEEAMALSDRVGGCRSPCPTGTSTTAPGSPAWVSGSRSP